MTSNFCLFVQFVYFVYAFFSFCADTPKHTKGKKKLYKTHKMRKIVFLLIFILHGHTKWNKQVFEVVFFSLCLYTQNKRMFLMFFFQTMREWTNLSRKTREITRTLFYAKFTIFPTVTVIIQCQCPPWPPLCSKSIDLMSL